MAASAIIIMINLIIIMINLIIMFTMFIIIIMINLIDSIIIMVNLDNDIDSCKSFPQCGSQRSLNQVGMLPA